ncbi:Acyl-CoA dehydrogenase [Frankia canadensis]|uniref:Acyl-CoA dehydrogenase n=1 Tax=Frankia canadensis TaxID=1836972 RepID=A0A2I2KWP7_9ACTN|nr:acyl-CoA dehydrogenase family protein [Frankia canadensis]SNQ50078.1 Acyl-CoA dehydrogenase [Frankia canadensis]SOU57368.1 Acyl-CoA dehydrogenase [Frankia canadensis]
MSSTSTPATGGRSFVASLDSGRLRWDRVAPFPAEDPVQRRRADEIVERVGAFVEARIDPEEVDGTAALPDGFVEELRERGFLSLRQSAEIGGHDLSAYGAFRVVTRAVSWSAPVGQLLGVQNGVAPFELARSLPAGAVRDLLEQRITERAIGGWADTELIGQNNSRPALTGYLTEDGSAYLLRGHKTFIGNGPLAELVAVTGLAATGEGEPRIAVFFADTRQPGLTVQAHEFVGAKGLPVGALTFDNLRVPREHVLLVGEENPQAAPQTRAMGIVGRMYSTSGPALAIGRLCLQWSREFVSRRFIDGRNLGEYDLIQRIVATSLADVFATESVLQWSLIGPGLADRWFELVWSMNVSRAANWRIVDQTVSLLGGEGIETARSKRRRGAQPLPVERFFRDARLIRTIGNVDFQVDNITGRQYLARFYGPEADRIGSAATGGEDTLAFAASADLSPANLEHLGALGEETRRFAAATRQLVRRYPDPRELALHEQSLVLISRIASELYTAAVTLARASHLASDDGGASQGLADVYLTEARHRVEALWRRLAPAIAEPDHAKISRDWLAGASFDQLLTH